MADSDERDDAAVDPVSDDELVDPDANDADETGPREGPDGREVIVPMRLYKTVVVFSTLVAIVAFILGFLLLDAATLQETVLRSLILVAISGLGLQVAADVVSALLAVAGLTFIGFGAAVYVFGTRFRFRGMGKPQEDSAEASDDG